jgi:hypothetical protein
MITIEKTIPVWAYVALVNSDESGLTDQDSADLARFSLDLKYAHYNAIPLSDYDDLGFCHGNDLNRLGDHCYRVKFQYLDDGYCPDGFIFKTVDRPLDWQKRGLSYTASGYGSKIPTSRIAICNDGRERRIYCRVYSNAGSCFIVYKGNPLFVI